jgi:gluconolactonase
MPPSSVYPRFLPTKTEFTSHGLEPSLEYHGSPPHSTTITDTPQPRILAEGLNYPEGPAFDHYGRLWFSELKSGNICCLRNGEIKRFHVGGEPNGVAFDSAGRIVFCDSKDCSIRRYDPLSGKTKVLIERLDGKPLFIPNDLAFDSLGNLVFSCSGNSRNLPTGYVCVLTRKGEVRRIGSGFYFPNGLAFSPDGRHLVVAETSRQRLWRGYWDVKRALWSELRPWADIGGAIGPAGMAFGGDGRLYVAVQGDGVIKSVTPEGKTEVVATLTENLLTNCAFDPDNTLGLVVTEAQTGRLKSLPSLSLGSAIFTPPGRRSLLSKCLAALY